MVVRDRVCGVCGETKPETAFYRNRGSKEGRLRRCKQCHEDHLRRLKKNRRETYNPPDERTMKRCPKCGIVKGCKDFGVLKTSKDGLSFWCRDCAFSHRKKWRDEGGKERLVQYRKQHYLKHRDELRERSLTRHRLLRQAALEKYSDGDVRCCCCGEREPKFLGIDHINGGGKKHLKEIKATNIYYWAKIHGYPPGFQVLCHNCNLAKGFYGSCPHQEGQKSSE